jgi:NifU-like protein involved in Fe-S cluster formation
MIDDVYSMDVLRLAGNITRAERLAEPDATVSLRSPLCGSSITVDIVYADGRVSDFGQQIKACALGQAAASVMAAQVVGKSLGEIEAVRDRMRAMLEDDGPAPEGDWAGLAALKPAHRIKARHGAILLPFRAVVQAIEEIEGAAEQADASG